MNIADLRQEYIRARLAEALPDPFAKFGYWFGGALAVDLQLANAMHSPRCPMRVLAPTEN